MRSTRDYWLAFFLWVKPHEGDISHGRIRNMNAGDNTSALLRRSGKEEQA